MKCIHISVSKYLQKLEMEYIENQAWFQASIEV